MSYFLHVAVTASIVAAVLAYDNGAPHSLLPPLGWSSWVALGPGADHPVFDYCDEFSVKAAADAFVEVGLFDAGYRHFHLDDCWAGGRNETGFLYPEADHFPNGMAPVVEYVHSKGLTFGLYTCAGTETCVGHRPGSKVLTHHSVPRLQSNSYLIFYQDHWQQDASVWAEWGVDWVKQDWCNTQGSFCLCLHLNAQSFCIHVMAGMDIKTSYQAMSSALNKTGRQIHFNMCEWGKESPWNWGNTMAQVTHRCIACCEHYKIGLF